MSHFKGDPSKLLLHDAILVLIAAAVIGLITAFGSARAAGRPIEILNVSYDVSRELFAEINPAFAAEWQKKTGQ